jgi:hypothetical protein
VLPGVAVALPGLNMWSPQQDVEALAPSKLRVIRERKEESLQEITQEELCTRVRAVAFGWQAIQEQFCSGGRESAIFADVVTLSLLSPNAVHVRKSIVQVGLV